MKPAPSFHLGGNSSDAYYAKAHHNKQIKTSTSALRDSYLEMPVKQRGEISNEKHREILQTGNFAKVMSNAKQITKDNRRIFNGLCETESRIPQPQI